MQKSIVSEICIIACTINGLSIYIRNTLMTYFYCKIVLHMLWNVQQYIQYELVFEAFSGIGDSDLWRLSFWEKKMRWKFYIISANFPLFSLILASSVYSFWRFKQFGVMVFRAFIFLVNQDNLCQTTYNPKNHKSFLEAN